jgi:hypothetical protein
VAVQLVLPGLRANFDPGLELERLDRAKLQLVADLSAAIDKCGETFGLGRHAVYRAKVVAEDMFSGLFYDLEQELKTDVEEEIRQGDWPHGHPSGRRY